MCFVLCALRSVLCACALCSVLFAVCFVLSAWCLWEPSLGVASQREIYKGWWRTQGLAASCSKCTESQPHHDLQNGHVNMHSRLIVNLVWSHSWFNSRAVQAMQFLRISPSNQSQLIHINHIKYVVATSKMFYHNFCHSHQPTGAAAGHSSSQLSWSKNLNWLVSHSHHSFIFQ